MDPPLRDKVNARVWNGNILTGPPNPTPPKKSSKRIKSQERYAYRTHQGYYWNVIKGRVQQRTVLKPAI